MANTVLNSSPSHSSGLLTASKLVVPRPCALLGYSLTAATATATLKIFDNNVAIGIPNLQAVNQILSTNNTTVTQTTGLNGVEMLKGIYAELTGTGAVVILHYSLL